MSTSTNARAEATRQFAHEANRARHNYQSRAVGITELLILNRGLIRDVVLPKLTGTDSNVGAFLGRVLRAIDEAAAAKTDAIQAETDWLGSILPHVEDLKETPNA